MVPSTGRRSGGYTLIECIAVIAILGVGLTACVGSMTAALVSNQKASDIELATAVAQGTIEDLRSQGFQACSYVDGLPAHTTPATAEADDPLYGCELHSVARDLAITDAYTGDDRLKKLAVTVSWRGRTGQTEQVVVETIVTNRTGHTST